MAHLRNNPCYCGSNKKYKNCCRLKDHDWDEAIYIDKQISAQAKGSKKSNRLYMALALSMLERF